MPGADSTTGTSGGRRALDQRLRAVTARRSPTRRRRARRPTRRVRTRLRGEDRARRPDWARGTPDLVATAAQGIDLLVRQINVMIDDGHAPSCTPRSGIAKRSVRRASDGWCPGVTPLAFEPGLATLALQDRLREIGPVDDEREHRPIARAPEGTGGRGCFTPASARERVSVAIHPDMSSTSARIDFALDERGTAIVEDTGRLVVSRGRGSRGR